MSATQARVAADNSDVKPSGNAFPQVVLDMTHRGEQPVRCRAGRPGKCILLHRDAKLLYCIAGNRKTFERQRVQHLIGDHDAAKSFRRRRQPFDVVSELGNGLANQIFLSRLQVRRNLENLVALGKRIQSFQRPNDVDGELAAASTKLEDVSIP